MWNGGGKETDRDTGPSTFFMKLEPPSWTQLVHTGMLMWGVVRANGGIPPWGSMKERAMPSLYSECFFMN